MEKMIMDEKKIPEMDKNPRNDPFNERQHDPMHYNDREILSPTERSQERLGILLSTLERGWKIVVMREQPSWCRGHLETIEYFGDEDEPVDIEYLVRTWGGKRLHVKILGDRGRWLGGASIPLYSYEPKVRGKIIHENDHYGTTQGPNATTTPALSPYYPPPQQSSPSGQLDLTKIIELMSRQKGSDIGSMLKLLEYAQGRSAIQAPQSQNSMDQFMQMATMFRQMRDIFGDLSGPRETDSDSIMPIAGEVIKSLLNRQNNDKPPRRGTLLPPKMESKPSLLPQQPKSEQDNILSLSKKISDLPAEDAAGVAFLALDAMPPDKKQQVIESILSEMSGFVDEDEESDKIGSNGQS